MTIDWLSIIIGTAFSAAVAVVVYILTRKHRRPMYAYTCRPLIQKAKSEIDGLAITYHGEPVENLYSVHVAIWNNGKEPIRAGDVAQTAPTWITLANTNLLGDPTIVAAINPANSITATQEGNAVRLDFEYIGYKEGAVVQLYCNQPAGIAVSGTIIDSHGWEPALDREVSQSVDAIRSPQRQAGSVCPGCASANGLSPCQTCCTPLQTPPQPHTMSR